MKKALSLLLSVITIITSVSVFTISAQAETKQLEEGQRMTYIKTVGDSYYVRLYEELGNGKYSEDGEVGYIPKADANTAYFNTGRPWTSPYKAIYYGAKYIASGYLTYQYTMYLQKFNVNPASNNMFNHEYMTNVSGAYQEAVHLYNGYNRAGTLGDAHTFYIPVFNNMPAPDGTILAAPEAKDENGFPESYATILANLQSSYPNWKFIALDTGIDFEAAVNGENKNGIYTQEALRKYLDPRQSLDVQHIFQFESIKKEDSANSEAVVNAILTGTWMGNSAITYLDTEGNTVTDSDASTYAQAMLKASKDSGLSAYYIAGKIRQENGGTSNTATAVCGKKLPFLGIYNYFNIGAYGTASDGLAWAAGFMKTIKATTLTYEPSESTTTTAPAQTPAQKYTPTKIKLNSLTAYSSGHKIKVAWTKSQKSCTGYKIQWAKDKAFKNVIATTKVTGRSKVTYTGKNFTKGRKYYVRIKAYKKVGSKVYYGPWSNIKAKTAK